MNKEKSAVFFSSNCLDGDQAEVRSVLQIDTEALGREIFGALNCPGTLDQEGFRVYANQTEKTSWGLVWERSKQCGEGGFAQVSGTGGANIPDELLPRPERYLQKNENYNFKLLVGQLC